MQILRYSFFCLLILAATACGKNETAPSDGGNNKGSDKSLHIERAFFTDPHKVQEKSSDPTVLNWLIIYLDHTPKGAMVHINIYGFTHPEVLAAVQRAYDRGVVFKILIDNEHDYHTSNAKTIKTLTAMLHSPSEVIPVNNDARPSMKAIDHNKYVLFSEIHMPEGIAKNVVWAASHNFTVGQTKLLQDAVVMTNKGLYDAFLRDWEEIAPLAAEGMTQFEYFSQNVGDSIRTFFYPRLTNGVWDGKSTVIEQLDKLSDYTKDTVCVLMSEMHGALGLKIAEKLTEIQKKGVQVEVITRLEEPQTSAAVASELMNNLKSAGGYVKLIDNSKEGTVHSKTMLIKGVFEGKMQQIILTGSLNYHTNATGSNNNFQIMLKNSSLFKDYWENWSLVKKIF